MKLVDVTDNSAPDQKAGKIIKAGLIVIALFFAGLGGIAAFFPFGGAVITPGVVKISQEKKSVQHLEGGIVDQILVKEGDRVKKDDILIRLRSSNVKASVALLKGRLATKMVEAARLEAQMAFKNSFETPAELPGNVPHLNEIIKTEKDIFTQARNSLNSQIDIQKTRINQHKEKISGSEKELEANKEIISSYEEELNAKLPLLNEKYIDKSQILTIKRMIAERKGLEAKLIQQIAESKESIEELNLSVKTLQNKYREDAVNNLGKARDEIFQIGKQLSPQLDADERLDIRAPVAGTVINLEIHSENGGIVKPGAPILDIVPDDAELIVEGSLRQDKITQVHLGQNTRVQLAAFNRITTPPVNGKVSYISADSVLQKLPNGATNQSYLIHVRIDRQDLEKIGAWLAPGMPATCYVETEKRTFLQYLLEPIMLNIDSSLRETL